MMVVGTIVTLAIFLFVGWAVATEMFQQRTWRRRVESGDIAIVAALLEEALGAWRRSRPPRGTTANLWAGVQGAQLIAVTEEGATLSTSAEPEFRTEDGRRVQVSSALDEAIALAAKLVDMMLYDVPNLRLARVRVDVYTTFTSGEGAPVQMPILTTSAERAVSDGLTWDTMTPAEVLGRFETTYARNESGEGTAITLPPVVGGIPGQPYDEPAEATS